MYREHVHKAEEDYITHLNDANRSSLHEMNVKYIKFLKLEDTILKQKTQLQWFKDSDKNSKYFHSIIRGKKRKLFVHEIINEERKWIQDEEEIAQTACAHFEEIFTCEEKLINENNLECIPRMVSRE